MAAGASHVLIVNGEWVGESAGGCTNFPTVAHNPQWLMSLDCPNKINLRLEQLGEDNPIPIGIIVADKKGKPIKALYQGETVADSGSYVNQQSVEANMELTNKDYPYTILVSTFHPGIERKFTLTATSSAPLTLSPVTVHDEYADLPILAGVMSGSWKGASAGGCVNFDTVGGNPQYFIQVVEETRAAITLKQTRGASGVLHPINVAVVDKKGSLIHKVYRGEEVANSGVHINKEEVVCECTLAPSPFPYTILPSTFNPGEEADFTVTFRTDKPVFVSTEPVAEIRSGAEVAELHATSQAKVPTASGTTTTPLSSVSSVKTPASSSSPSNVKATARDDFLADLAAVSDRVAANSNAELTALRESQRNR